MKTFVIYGLGVIPTVNWNSLPESPAARQMMHYGCRIKVIMHYVRICTTVEPSRLASYAKRSEGESTGSPTLPTTDPAEAMDVWQL